MKYTSLIIFFMLGLLPRGNSQVNNVKSQNVEISLLGNGYVYPQQDEDADQNVILNQGLHNWNDSKIYVRVFFYPQQEGMLSVALKLKSEGMAEISLQLDGKGKPVKLKVDEAADSVTIPAGAFEVKGSVYHFIEIKGISKSGKNFPDIRSLIVSGPAANNIKFNLTPYRGAASTHLWYQYPKDSSIAWFYNEVTVPVGVDATNAYYMTNGFADGYMGIQLNSKTERRFIFSVWSNYNTDDPKEIPKDFAVTLIKKGADVYADEFGNEGSGGHSHLVFPWKQGVTYKMLLGAKSAGDHTIFSAYYLTPGTSSWQLMAQWDKTKTGGKLLSGLYSFVENFGPNGNDFFKADYGNQWVCTSSGTWIELTKCFLTTTAGPSKHQRYDYGAGVENNFFYMFSGGFKEMNNLAPRSEISRKPNGKAPQINFATLPAQ